MSEDVKTRLIKIVSETLEVPVENIAPEHYFVDDLDAESIQSVELMAAFEEEFDIEMDEDEAMEVKTVGAAIEFVEKCLREQKS